MESPYDDATWRRAERAYTLYAAHLTAAGVPPLPRFAALPPYEQEAFCALALALWLEGQRATPPPPPAAPSGPRPAD